MAQCLASFFYVGRCPFAPGSLASLTGVLIYLILWGRWPVYLAVLLGVTVIGFLVSGKVEKLLKEKDPGCIVIDEVAGVLMAFLMLPPTLPVMITAYFLFRALDMFKIYPLNKFEELPGAVGVMLDDLMAGVYTNIVMQAAIRIGEMNH